jgi:hypothetical protein
MEGREVKDYDKKRQKLLGKILRKSLKRVPLELGSANTAVNRSNMVKPHRLSLP